MWSLLCMLAPHVISPSLTSFLGPHMAVCPSDVCPSPLMPRVFLSAVRPHMIGASGQAGWAAHVIHLCLGTRTQRALFSFCVCACGLAGTPLHVPLLGLGRMECSIVVPLV